MSKLKKGEILGKLSYAKNEYNVFLSQIRCSVFTLFSGKALFSEGTAKNCFEGVFDY